LLSEKENVESFDSLFELISSLPLKKYFKKNFPILVKATSVRSELTSTPTIQSIGKKAIVKALV
jgi:putative N6-adenine-specific DNA methylase